MPREYAAIDVPPVLERLEDRTLFAAGALDTTFNSTGILKKSVRDTNDYIDVVPQRDGKVVAVGQSQKSKQTKDALVAQYKADGTPDTAFGSSGVTFLNLSSTVDDIATAAAVQKDGKIVVAGFIGSGTATDMFITRLTSAGKIDTTFGTKGTVKLDFKSGSTDAAFGLVIQSDGKIVVSGFSGSVASVSMGIALARLTTGGKLDATFGTAGKTVTFGGLLTIEVGARMVMQSDGKFLVAMTRGSLGFTGISALQFGIARFDTKGKLDGTFNGTGKAFAQFGNTIEIATSVAIDSKTGNVIVAGTTSNGILEFGTSLPTGIPGLKTATKAAFAAARFTSLGKPDTTFSSDGKTTVAFGSGSVARLDGATDVQVDGSSRVYLSGASLIKGTGNLPKFAAARLKKNGALDTVFRSTGKAIYDAGASEGSFGACFTSGNKFLLAGHSKQSGSKGSAMLVEVLI